MSGGTHERLTRLFLHASRLDGPAREAYLDANCGDDAGLRDELEQLLAQDERLPPILSRVATDRDLAAAVRRPRLVGPYRILRQIGEGGMGVVYLAEQEQPVRRRVALKLIRPGYETQTVLARFEAERRMLSLLDHPAIARILDAGAAEDGRPYFAMEFVAGRPITSYCDEERLSIRRRLELFCEVCDAVQHAHHNSVIHRDLKPSNILVSTIDGRAFPKIIDFGVAKLLDPELGFARDLTLHLQPIGTPEYMSPEQAGLDNRPPDTRADVYSLGCMLFEILVGESPFAPAGWGSGGGEEIRRVLQQEAPTPSDRVTQLTASLGDSARRRQATPAGLARRLRGDLDCIVTQCLRKERERRYASAAELASDIRRHLDRDPISARPDSPWYRVGRFARKNPTVSALTLVLVPLLVVFAVTMAIQAQRTARERDRARDFSDFLLDLWEAPHSVSGRHPPPPLAELLESLPERSEQRFSGRPVMQARFAQGIGNLFRMAGDEARALPLLTRTAEQLRAQLGEDHAWTLQARNDLAQALAISGSTDDALERFDEVISARRRTLGDDHIDTLRSLADQGFWLKATRRFDESAVRLEEAQAGLARRLGAGEPETLTATALLGAVYLELHRFDEAESLLAGTLDPMSPEHPEYRFVLYNLAAVHAQLGHPETAEGFLERSFAAGMNGWFYGDAFFLPLHDRPEFDAIARRARVRQGFEHSLDDRGIRLIESGEYAEAELTLRFLLSEGSPEYHNRRYGGLSRIAKARGDLAGIVAIYLEILDRDSLLHGPTSEAVGTTEWYLGVALIGAGETAAGVDWLEKALEILSADPRVRNWAHYIRAQLAAVRGDRELALEEFRRAADAGFNVLAVLEDDPALGRYLDEPEFAEIRSRLLRRHLPL